MENDTTIPFSLASVYNAEGEISYEIVKAIAARIISGSCRIVRLNDREEHGRIFGGQRNVESSLIAGAEEGTSPKGESQERAVQRSEEALEVYARHEGIWVEDLDSEYPQIAEGFEAIVYADSNPDFVIKSARFADSSPLETLDQRISLFNFLFPETAYELIGFTRDSKGLRFVLLQRFIIGNIEIEDVKGLASRMRQEGLFATANSSKNFDNSNYSVRDVHNQNYIKVGDDVFIIDAITTLKTAEFGGLREYLPFEIISST
ncbi:MAG: hypothetical protein WBO10_17495 [Pyrinomonadaceae bacterium]